MAISLLGIPVWKVRSLIIIILLWLQLQIIPDDLTVNSSIPNHNKTKILSLNCCSLRSSEKRANFLALVDENNPDIICGCESHLGGQYYTAEVFPSNFTVFRKDRVEGGGGVFLCIKECLNVTEQPELDVSAEFVWAKITLAKRNPIYICSFYRPPAPFIEPILYLQTSLNSLINQTNELPNIILTGDFNFPSINWCDGSGQLSLYPTYGSELNNLFLDVVNDVGLEQFVTSPTRWESILDLVFSTYSNISDLSIIPGMSDHEAVVFCVDMESKTTNNKIEHKAALYHKANLESIKDDLSSFQTSFLESDPYSRSVEQNWCDLKNAITVTVSKNVPHKTIRSRTSLPWINKEIKRNMRKRKRLYNRARKRNFSEDWNAYRKMKNSINSMLKTAHNNYFSKLFDGSFSGNRRQFWKYIRAKRKDNHNISTLVTNGLPISDSKEKANVLNKHFESVFTKENLSNVPVMNQSNNLLPGMPDTTFSVTGIQHQLSILDTNKASGPDNISPFILKHCSNEISPILQVIFMQSMDTGVLPSDWLKANVCPVFKKGNRTHASNYRPISLTSICCKTMEHIIYQSIIQHLNSFNVFIENQHGFRSQHSCVTQLISLLEDLSYSMDHHQQTDVILLDFAKAFDSVPHQRLLVKLRHYGITNNICHWISTWLTQRSQQVVLDGASSESVSVQYGVPQGTVLGSLMFLIYINDITESISSPLQLFADDCILYRTITTEEDAIQLQNDLGQLSAWAIKWQLRFNVTKCTIMCFTRSSSPIHSIIN